MTRTKVETRFQLKKIKAPSSSYLNCKLNIWGFWIFGQRIYFIWTHHLWWLKISQTCCIGCVFDFQSPVPVSHWILLAMTPPLSLWHQRLHWYLLIRQSLWSHCGCPERTPVSAAPCRSAPAGLEENCSSHHSFSHSFHEGLTGITRFPQLYYKPGGHCAQVSVITFYMKMY